jgi:hypothetical protein
LIFHIGIRDTSHFSITSPFFKPGWIMKSRQKSPHSLKFARLQHTI